MCECVFSFLSNICYTRLFFVCEVRFGVKQIVAVQTINMSLTMNTGNIFEIFVQVEFKISYNL